MVRAAFCQGPSALISIITRRECLGRAVSLGGHRCLGADLWPLIQQVMAGKPEIFIQRVTERSNYFGIKQDPADAPIQGRVQPPLYHREIAQMTVSALFERDPANIRNPKNENEWQNSQ